MNYLDFLSDTGELYERRMAPVSQAFDLTSMELTILLFLANNPGCDTAAAIIKKRNLTKSHVSTSVRSLTEKGYIRKEYRDGDRKSVHLVLLPESGPVILKGQTAQETFLKDLSRGIQEEELTLVHDCFLQVYSNVTRALEEK